MNHNENHPKDRDIVEKVRQTVFKYTMIEKGETIIVAVSGGVDSMSLLAVLHGLQSEYNLNLVIAHLHHGLRGRDADKEYHFVETQARAFNVPFEGLIIKPEAYHNSGNIQEQARTFRYRFFEKIAQKWSAQKIATGHHQDDHVETLLLQLFRGAGTLKGMAPVRDNRYIRPLIDLTRKEVAGFAGQMGLPFCEDASNQKRTYLRNRIRLELIPWLQKEVNPSFSAALRRLSSVLMEENDLLETMTQESLKKIELPSPSEDRIVLNRRLFNELPGALQRRLLRETYLKLMGSASGLSYIHIESVYENLKQNRGTPSKMFTLPQRCRLYLDYDVICLSATDIWRKTPYQYALSFGKGCHIPEADMDLMTRIVPGDQISRESGDQRYNVCLDADRSKGEITVRNFRDGDRFYPLGAGGRKKVKDFFIDQKIPRSFRHRIPILEINGEIAWIIGFRMDERFKMVTGSREGLEVQVYPDLDSKGSLWSMLF